MKLFHATNERNLSAIISEGLKPCNPGDKDPRLDYQPQAVYLWRHLEDAWGYAKHFVTPAVLEVEVPDDIVIDDWELDMCDCCYKSAAVMTRRLIPPSSIQRVTTKPEVK